MSDETIPGCALQLPVETLSTWRDHALPEAEARRVAAHVPSCAACRQLLAEYDAVARALKTLRVPEPVGGYDHNPRPRAGFAETRRETGGGPRLRLVPPSDLGALAAVLLIAVLAASLLAYFGPGRPGPVAKPTPTFDAQTRAYLDVLNTYYRPLGSDMNTDDLWSLTWCATCSNALQQMDHERPVEARIVSEAQAFLDHLTVAPPARLRADDGYLKQAARLTASLYVKRLARIDAQDVQGFDVDRAGNDYVTNRIQYCGPIKDINALFNAALPVSVNACQLESDFPTPTP